MCSDYSLETESGISDEDLENKLKDLFVNHNNVPHTFIKDLL